MSHEKGERKFQPHTRGFPTGVDLLNNPGLNKGVAFANEEREILKLRGLLPPQVLGQESQVSLILDNCRKKPNDLERFVYLSSWLECNEALFYHALVDNLDELMPIVYTPTVGEACQEYGQIFQRPRGLFITAHDRGRISEILRNWPYARPRVIVITDGERILGLGDLGVNGMGIPIGKLALYVACGGVYPSQCLPITLDVGTNNQTLLDDPLYLGLKQHRLRGEAYDTLLDEFFEAAQEVFPDALVQMEDFGNQNAFRLLEHYRHDYCMFNDDIQGTAAVAVAGLFSASRITNKSLADQKILFLGAGEAGIGIGELFVSALKNDGMSEAEARTRCWYVDSKGLVVSSRTDLTEHKRHFAHDHEMLKDLDAIIDALKPTAIIGASGQTGAITQSMVEKMCANNPRPVIFALSNPTSKAECTAEQAYTWSKGQVIFASGSPFKPVTYNGQTFVPGQGNNAYIFPGVGLGATICQTREVPDSMFLAAAHTLADHVTEEDLAKGCIYPPLSAIREVSANIAAAVMKIAYAEGLARHAQPLGDNWADYARAHMYNPSYHSYV